MKKRFLSLLLCFCMALSLLPMSALAAEYDSWEAATDGVTLTEGTDTVTIDGVAYLYKSDGGTSGIQMYTLNGPDATALTENCCWKAGSGYVLYQPTVESGKTTSAVVTLHDAAISTSDAKALSLPANPQGSALYHVPVTVKVEGTNSLVTTDASYDALYHEAGTTTFTGGGSLSITGRLFHKDAVTIVSGTQVTVGNSMSKQIVGDLTVTGSGSKLTIASGANLVIGVFGGNPTATVTVGNGAVLENNGTLWMSEKVDKGNSHIIGEISGSGGIQLDDKTYTLVDGVFYPYGGDASTSGLDLSSSAPTETTRYKAGSGYISYTPAVTGDHAANAKLELHGAQISTTNATALKLPADAPVDIVVASDSSLTAGGSGNVIDTNGQSLSIKGSGNLTLTGPYYGIRVNGAGDINIDLDGDLTFDVASQPISTTGNITVSAKSITSKTGYYFYGNNVSLTATDGDISLTTKDSDNGAVSGSGGVSLAASKGAVTIHHSDNANGGYALQGTEAFVSALKGVTITTSRGAIKASSGAVSVSSTTGSIQMDCGDYYECVKASGAVALNAAEHITLSGGETSSTAIMSSSGQTVKLTAGGKLSSASAYGFQVGALTIKANEVSIEGTTQDGIQANSVSITNPTDGNCKSVSVTATSSQDTRAAITALGSAATGNITVKADDLFLCGNGSAKAISANGTVTIGDAGMILGAIAAGTKSIAAGITCASVSGGDKSDGLNLSTPPSVATYYTADSGYVLFTPATTSPAAPAKLTLHNATIHNSASINDETGAGIALPDGAATLAVEGTNTISAQATDAISGSNTDITLSGTGVLNVGHNGIALKSTAANPHSFTKGTSVTLNGIVNTYDNSSESGTSDTNTVYGSVTFSSNATLLGTVSVTQGATMTIQQDATLDLRFTTAITNNGTILNNGTIVLPDGTAATAIKGLKLTGTGIVKVGSQYYTNDGIAVTVISGNLDLSTGDHSGATLESDGYTFSNNTLTLSNTYVSGGLTLPDHTTICTTSDSIISGPIIGVSGEHTHLTFTGTAPLSINGSISLGVEEDSVTVQDGAQVTVNGGFSLGAYGLDGILNVIGSGTVLNISSDSSYAVMCGAVNVQNGAALTAHSEGAYGLYALASGVSVTGGSTLTVGCDYGVYVKDGSFTIDESSSFTANASIAAVCVVDTTKTKTQSQTLKVPSSMLPSGTKITSDTYWSIANSASIVLATNEGSDPATIANALGALTLKKVSSPIGGGSDSTSVSYTLSFETNGGSAIDKRSKTSGTVIDLSANNPTRGGYTFVGWYSDAALTNQLTSVTLAKNTTVYAKWTANSANPFADVSDNAYYHHAVLWAVEKNIPNGTTSTTFSPDMICTRAQAVTFLWRTAGETTSASANPFTDVSEDAYYYNAVLWAVENGITNGNSATTFSPSNFCTRAQIVTFLYRYAGE